MRFALWILLLTGFLAPRVYAIDFQITNGAGEPVSGAVVSLYDPTVASAPVVAAAEMDQVDLQFVPQVLAIQTGTQVIFPNRDDIRHHVYSFSPAKRFELRLYHGTTADPVQFDIPGKVVLGCNIHDSMLGYIYVLDTPYFAVTDVAGRVQFTDLPSGQYRYQVQHPRTNQVLDGVLTNEQEQLSINLGDLIPDPRQSAPRTELEALFDR